MKRQHANPYIIRNNQVHLLQRVTGEAHGQFDEAWLQKFVFTNPASIPINEIEAAFGPLIPVCRELPTKAGFIDLLFMNGAGLLTIIECKLWKNPEARREVVGQILDYAKELSRWSYDDLQTAIGNAQESAKLSIYKLIRQHTDEGIADESEFIDSISRNLRKGRFLLLIVGDGIRENVEHMTDFLQEYAHLNFSFALVEYPIFKLPNQEGEFFIQPRLVTQTVEIERAVVRIENEQVVSISASENNAPLPRKRTKISEQVFFENLKADAATKANLKTFFERLQGIGLNIEPGQNSMKIKSELGGTNFCIFTTSGEFYNRAIGSSTQEMGVPDIGENYLSQLAGLFEHGIVNRESKSRFMWTVQIKQGSKYRYPDVAEVIAVQDRLIEIIQKTLNDISEIQAA